MTSRPVRQRPTKKCPVSLLLLAMGLLLPPPRTLLVLDFGLTM